jgi:hypothetical protein
MKKIGKKIGSTQVRTGTKLLKVTYSTTRVLLPDIIFVVETNSQLHNSTTPQLHNSTTPQLHNSTTPQLHNSKKKITT